MYQYSYKRVRNTFLGDDFSDCRDIIDDYASRGYRYVGYIPIAIALDGKIKSIDLIFEKRIRPREQAEREA